MTVNEADLRAWLSRCAAMEGEAREIVDAQAIPANRHYADGFCDGVKETLAQLEHFLDHGETTGEVLS